MILVNFYNTIQRAAKLRPRHRAKTKSSEAAILSICLSVCSVLSICLSVYFVFPKIHPK